VSFVAYTIVSLILIALSAVLIAMHRHVWHRSQNDASADDVEREFIRNQCRRRVQASGMIGVVGVAIFIGQFTGKYPLLWVFYWGGVILVLFWIILLALGDAIATRAYYQRVRRKDLNEQAQLHAELRRLQKPDSNGHSSEPLEE